MDFTLEVILLIVLVIALPIAAALFTHLFLRVRELERGKKRLPYRVDNGLLDVTALNNYALMEIQAAIAQAENYIKMQHVLIGEIRRGENDPESPAKSVQ